MAWFFTTFVLLNTFIMQGILHAHSGLRYLVVLLIIISVIKSLAGWLGKKPYSGLDGKLHLFTMISGHLQVLLGLALYFMSPKVNFEAMDNPAVRFWNVEHISAMIIAVVLLTVGRKMATKTADDAGKHMKVALFFIAAIALIWWAIPAEAWPWNK